MKKGFKDIEEYFLQAEARKVQKPTRESKPTSKENLIKQIENLKEKIKDRDKKIETLKSGHKTRVELLLQEISQLKERLAEKKKEVELLKASEVPKPKVELLIEVALKALSSITAEKNKFKVLFSRQFRNDTIREVSLKPFLFECFVSALSSIETNSRLLKRGRKDIYRLRVTSPYGEFRAVYTNISTDMVKFHRFGPREMVYKELNGSNWSLD